MSLTNGTRKRIKQQATPKQTKLNAWVDSKTGCIVTVGACIAFIAVFIANIVLNHNWLNIIFIVLYGAILRNRLRRLRSFND